MLCMVRFAFLFYHLLYGLKTNSKLAFEVVANILGHGFLLHLFLLLVKVADDYWYNYRRKRLNILKT